MIGHEFEIESFKRAYEKGRLSHAYIIEGPDGNGKSIFAKYIASVILCKEAVKPCGVCSSCIKIQHDNHPDLTTVSNKGRSIGVDEIRELIDEIYTKPYEGDKRVVIIKNSDLITVQGQNAILKTLEEPSDHTTIIMLVENMKLILETIRSRCQIIRLGRIPLDRIKKYLVNKGFEEKKAGAVANLSDGILGNAEKFLDEKFLRLREDTINTARKLVKPDMLGAIQCTDFFMSNKNSIDSILDIMTAWYRDIVMLKLAKDRNMLMNLDYYDLLVEESQKLSYNKLDGIISIINSSREKIKQNVNYQLTIEMMLLNIQEV